jgi:hypothetical protein
MLGHDPVQRLHAHVALDFVLSHDHPLIPQTVIRNLNSSHVRHAPSRELFKGEQAVR